MAGFALTLLRRHLSAGHVFKPGLTHVRAGDTIIFDNKDKDLHALTLAGREDLLDEEYIDPGRPFRFVVPADMAPGERRRNGSIHVEMHAKIVIDPPQ